MTAIEARNRVAAHQHARRLETVRGIVERIEGAAIKGGTEIVVHVSEVTDEQATALRQLGYRVEPQSEYLGEPMVCVSW